MCRAGAEPFDHGRQPPRLFAMGRGALQFAAGMVQADIFRPAIGEAPIQEFRLAAGQSKAEVRKIKHRALFQRRLGPRPCLDLEGPRPGGDIECFKHQAKLSLIAP